MFVHQKLKFTRSTSNAYRYKLFEIPANSKQFPEILVIEIDNSKRINNLVSVVSMGKILSSKTWKLSKHYIHVPENVFFIFIVIYWVLLGNIVNSMIYVPCAMLTLVR